MLHNGRAVLDLPKTDAHDRLIQAWPEEFREMRLPIDLPDAELHMHGIVGLPELGEGRRLGINISISTIGRFEISLFSTRCAKRIAG